MGKITQLIDKDVWRPWAVAGVLAIVSAASVFSLDAWAHGDGPPRPDGVQAVHQGHRPMGGPDGMGMLPLGGRHLDRLLDEVKATDAQRAQIKALAKAAEADLKPLHETERGIHEQTLALFGQPQVDAAAAEKLRQQMLASHDAVSKRVLQTVLDVSKVLTPEQRIALVAKVQKRHEEMKSHHEEHARLEQ
jgi:Spy/CpxP family protein refolding chaperone